MGAPGDAECGTWLESEGVESVRCEHSRSNGVESALAANTGEAREWELENVARHRAGELNDAELGMANLKQAMSDPSLLSSVK